MLKVGSIIKLKVDCLDNKAGTIGVIYEVYDIGLTDPICGVSVIFPNGNYDGFSTVRKMAKLNITEAEYFFEETGFEPTLANYQFKNVMQLSKDYRNKVFNIVWLKEWGN